MQGADADNWSQASRWTRVGCKRCSLTDRLVQAYFLVVYDRDSGQVVGFYDNKNEALLGLYLKHTPYFHAACMSQPWARFLTPCPASLHLPDPQLPHSWSQSQVSAPRSYCFDMLFCMRRVKLFLAGSAPHAAECMRRRIYHQQVVLSINTDLR